jgi:hypothetical protein
MYISVPYKLRGFSYFNENFIDNNQAISYNNYGYVISAAFLIDTNKTLNQDLEPNQVCSIYRFLQRE